MVDRVYENLNSKFVDNQDAHGQIENDETGEPIHSEDTEPTEQYSQVHQSNLASGNFIYETIFNIYFIYFIYEKNVSSKKISSD